MVDIKSGNAGYCVTVKCVTIMEKMMTGGQMGVNNIAD
jgi:hypothetical protein